MGLQPRCLAFTADGSRLASDSRVRTIQAWGIGKRRSITLLKRYSNPIDFKTFSADGSKLRSASVGGAARLEPTTALPYFQNMHGDTSYLHQTAQDPLRHLAEWRSRGMAEQELTPFLPHLQDGRSHDTDEVKSDCAQTNLSHPNRSRCRTPPFYRTGDTTTNIKCEDSPTGDINNAPLKRYTTWLPIVDCRHQDLRMDLNRDIAEQTARSFQKRTAAWRDV